MVRTNHDQTNSYFVVNVSFKRQDIKMELAHHPHDFFMMSTRLHTTLRPHYGQG